jgi:capsular polysaccharide biosynthesis protein
MDIVTILRRLRRQRGLVVLAAVWALLAGFGVAFRIEPGFKLESRAHTVALATTRILVDTPSSQVVQVAPKGSDALGVRATLLSNLMVEGVIKTAIAKRAGLLPADFGGFAETASQASAKTPDKSRSYLLTTRVLTNPGGDQLPVIEIEAQAPDPGRAVGLANAAVSGLQDYLDSRASDEQVSAAQRLRVNGLGSAQVREEVRGPGLMVVLAVMLVVFVGTSCVAIFLPTLVGAWLESSKEEDRAAAASGEPREGVADEDVTPPVGLFDADDDAIFGGSNAEAGYREARVETH